MFEFALLVPLVMFLIAFTIDMGRIVSISSTLYDATSVAARAGARVGYSGLMPEKNICKNVISNSAPSYHAFCEAYRPIAGAELITVAVISPLSEDGIGSCASNSHSNSFVTIRSTAKVDLLTPGLESLLTAIRKGSQISTIAAAKCEISK